MTRLVEQKNAIDVLNLDLSKAFDKVDHNLLLWKVLEQCGMDDSSIRWIHIWQTIVAKIWSLIGLCPHGRSMQWDISVF